MTRTNRSTLTLAAFSFKALSLIVAMLNPGATCLAASPQQSSTAKLYGPSRWHHDFDEATKQARDLGLPLVIHFGATWCRPCLQMEREILGTPEFTSRLGRQIIGLKVDWDKQPDLIQKFGLKAVPCDIVMSPDGLIEERHQKTQRRHEYFAMADRASSRFRHEREDALARQKNQADRRFEPEAKRFDKPLADDPTRQSGRPIARLAENVEGAESGARNRTSSRSRDLAAFNDHAAAQFPEPRRSSPSERSAAGAPGLEGYCPVSIKDARRWVKGDAEHTATWRGVVYHMASEAELRRFTAAPHEYAPRMLGCDPVVLLESGRAIAGHIEFCAIYNGDLFLFTSGASLNRFKVNPDRYVSLPHAIRKSSEVPTR